MMVLKPLKWVEFVQFGRNMGKHIVLLTKTALRLGFTGATGEYGTGQCHTGENLCVTQGQWEKEAHTEFKNKSCINCML